MNFTRSENQIALHNESGELLAEITFPYIDNDTVDINHTFVDPSLRGQGIAGKLMNELTDELNESLAGHTPYRDEIRLFSCIEQGDVNRLIEEIKRHSDGGIFVGKMSENSLMQRKYMAVSSITLATRYAIQGGLNEDEAYSFSDRFIKTIDNLESDAEVMGCLLKNMYSLTQNVAKSKRELKYSPHVRKCVSYISKNLNKKITVASVAAELGLSADYISHLFRKETELSYKEIGTIMGKTEEWARITFYRAKIKLKEDLKNE